MSEFNLIYNFIEGIMIGFSFGTAIFFWYLQFHIPSVSRVRSEGEHCNCSKDSLHTKEVKGESK